MDEPVEEIGARLFLLGIDAENPICLFRPAQRAAREIELPAADPGDAKRLKQQLLAIGNALDQLVQRTRAVEQLIEAGPSLSGLGMARYRHCGLRLRMCTIASSIRECASTLGSTAQPAESRFEAGGVAAGEVAGLLDNSVAGEAALEAAKPRVERGELGIVHRRELLVAGDALVVEHRGELRSDALEAGELVAMVGRAGRKGD